MTTKSISISGICLPALVFLVMAGSAYAQGTFKGEWKILDASSPDWVGNKAAQKVDFAVTFVGGKVDFRSTEVVADGALGCSRASYQFITVGISEIFQGRAGASAMNAAEAAGINPGSRTLRVTCGNGESFDYHEAGKSIVVLHGDFLYTLMREEPS